MPKKKYLFTFAIILFILFIFFSYLVAKERFTKLDFDTTVKVQDHIPHKFDYIFSIFSLLGSLEVTVFVWLLLTGWVIIKKYWITLVSLFLLPFALFIELFGKLFVLHPSPPHLLYRGVIKFNLPSSYVQTEYSYPSGHLTRTAFILSFLAVYFLYNKPHKFQIIIQPILIVFLVTMTVSRVYLGEHWTSDVIGGLMVGTSFGIISGLTIPIKNLTAVFAKKIDKRVS